MAWCLVHAIQRTPFPPASSSSRSSKCTYLHPALLPLIPLLSHLTRRTALRRPAQAPNATTAQLQLSFPARAVRGVLLLRCC